MRTKTSWAPENSSQPSEKYESNKKSLRKFLSHIRPEWLFALKWTLFEIDWKQTV